MIYDIIVLQIVSFACNYRVFAETLLWHILCENWAISVTKQVSKYLWPLYNLASF